MQSQLLSPSSIDDAVSDLKDIASVLTRQFDLSPENPTVNQFLSLLVNKLTSWSVRPEMLHLLGHCDVQSLLSLLPEICGKAECEMEKWWSRKIVADSRDFGVALNYFWYINHYQSLVEAELELTEQLPGSSAVFLGAGALPITALLMVKNSGKKNFKVRCVDNDPVACELASEFIARSDFGCNIEVVLSCANEFFPDPEDIVYCASLLKSLGIYDHLYSCDVKHIVVRDVEGVYKFLYSTAQCPTSNLYVERRRTISDSSRINISRLFSRANHL